MKPTQNNKAKLQLKKQAISNLTKTEMENVKGGNVAEAAITTSKGSCTGWTCCDPTKSCPIWDITTIIIPITLG